MISLTAIWLGGTTFDVSGVVVLGCSTRLFLRSPLPVGKPEGTLVPGQPDTFVDSPRRGRRAARKRVLLVRPLPRQHAHLQGVEFPPDGLRAHRVPQLPEPVPQVPQAAEGHVADRDVRPHPLRLPVEHRPDPQVVLVGPEAVLDLPEPVVLPKQLLRPQAGVAV